MTRISSNTTAANHNKAHNDDIGGAHVSFRGGHLSVRGTKGDDDISVKQLDAKTVELTVNGETRTFNNVKSVAVNGGKGNDVVDAQRAQCDTFDREPSKRDALKLRVRGGKGDDQIQSDFDYAKLFGGHGQDEIVSSGNDTKLRGGRGDDVLEDSGIRADVRGGHGNDVILAKGTGARIHGGRGNDEILNDDPAARINGGPGKDKVLDETGTAKVRSAALVDDF